MAGDTANPRIWIGADCYIGPLGTTAPTDVTTALNAAFIPLGLLSEDSPTETLENDDTPYYAHGGVFVRNIRSKFRRQIHVVAEENNKTAWQAANPGSTVSSASGLTTRVIKTPTYSPQAMVLHLVDGTVTTRKVYPNVVLANVGDYPMGDTDIAAYDLTFDILSDSSGIAYREITNDPSAVVP